MKFYDYILAYPEQMGGAVFYVGKGSYSNEGRVDRIDMHEREARRGGTSRKCQIIREIWAQGYQIVKKKVFETDDEQDTFIYEWCLINLVYGRDNLTNQTNGGTVKRTWYDSQSAKTLPVKNQGFITTDSRVYQQWYQPQYKQRKAVDTLQILAHLSQTKDPPGLSIVRGLLLLLSIYLQWPSPGAYRPAPG